MNIQEVAEYWLAVPIWSSGQDVEDWQRLIGAAGDGVYGYQTRRKTIDIVFDCSWLDNLKDYEYLGTRGYARFKPKEERLLYSVPIRDYWRRNAIVERKV